MTGSCSASKGPQSEAELHVLKARLRGGIINKVQRGGIVVHCPRASLYDETGNVVPGPTAQIRDAIAPFKARGRFGQPDGVPVRVGFLPSRLRNRRHDCFRPLTASARCAR